ncbi:MAG: class I SAM-dependent methyltransferase, partial [bacterium]
DYTMKGLTLSPAQQAFAQKRLEHLGNNTNVALEDYRHQKDRYQHIVSIEMFEAVGEAFWPVYFSKIKTLLAEKGKAVIQTITVGDAFFDRYRQGGDAIRTFIFPGGMLPSPQRFRQETEKAGLHITDAFSFGQDYAVTLNHWLMNFENKLKEIKSMGFDDKFIRLWRFYLTCCIAAFRSGRTDVVQWELRHA